MTLAAAQLADAAPQGTGLAIIAVIMLALLGIVLGVVIFVVVKIVKFFRGRGDDAPAESPSG